MVVDQVDSIFACVVQFKMPVSICRAEKHLDSGIVSIQAIA